MLSRNFVFAAFCLLFVASALNTQTEARYLPTRSNGDRLDKLRELLKELLENEIEKEDSGDSPRWHPENKLFYKREAQLDDNSKK